MRTTHKTVRRVVERQERGAEPGRLSVRRERKTDPVRDLIERRVRETDARVSAKRLLPAARAAGYTGSDRRFRRGVAEAKRSWRRRRRVYRPWQPAPGEHLVIDYGTVTAGPLTGLHVFCPVLAWSRVRFVRFCRDETLATTLRLLADCFEALGAVPAVVLADRMGCLKGGVVANVVVPTAGYVRFATSYGFRPDFCEAADPESKGVVEALVGYAKRDLAVWLEELSADPADLAGLNQAAVAWCDQVNGREHSEIRAVPGERLTAERPAMRPLPSLRPTLQAGVVRKVDKLATVRFGSARYSVPAHLVGASVLVSAVDEQIVIHHAGDEVARHALVPPGGVALDDAHYDRPARRPSRAVRARTVEEKAFLALGPTAEGFPRAAAAAGTSRLATHLTAILALEAAHGRPALLTALERATAFRRFSSDDVRAILAAGPHAPQPPPAGHDLSVIPPAAPTRDLDAYRAGVLAVTR